MQIKREFQKNEFIKEISGKEFRESGAMWFVNQILHLFGMAISWNSDTDELKANIVKYRGFDQTLQDKGYELLTSYLKDNIAELEKDM
jgi:hypothetical protein